jgi:hypothetical protein
MNEVGGTTFVLLFVCFQYVASMFTIKLIFDYRNRSSLGGLIEASDACSINLYAYRTLKQINGEYYSFHSFYIL